jgi:hypothetical protein
VNLDSEIQNRSDAAVEFKNPEGLFLTQALRVTSTVHMDEIPLSGRSVDIELGGQEVITIDLDNLDPNPDDVLDLLKDGQCKVWVWTKLAGEYWRRGYLEAAEKIARSAVECKWISHLHISTNI